jgi:hypothetical protein
MGRYYDGDINGKFWFAVQDSNDADFFGVTGYQPEQLEYAFEEEHIPEVEAGIAKCEDALGVNKAKLDKFFKDNNGYNDKMLEDAGFDPKTVSGLLVWYARLNLGEKILASLKENKQCYFTAEC